MATYTATIKGTQKLYGFYGTGNGATYTITATNGTGVMKKFDVIRRPIRGGIPNVVQTSNSGVAVAYTESARFDFELEIWADVTTIGTFTITVTSSAGGDQITLLTAPPTSTGVAVDGVFNLAQSAVPVMIAQSGLLGSGGMLYPGVYTAGNLTLSATSGSVTATHTAAIFAGNATDVGKTVTFGDAGTIRSGVVTAAIGTTSATITLASTASGTGPFSNSTTFGNTLPTNYSGIWVNLPANAVNFGSAGFYWATAVSTATANGVLQVTTAYQSSMGVPSIPTGFSNAVGSGSNFTGVTSAVPVFQTTLPGSTMGNNGSFRVNERHTLCNNSNAKTIRLSYGGTTMGINDNEASKAGGGYIATVQNRSTSLQISPISGGDYSSLGSVYGTINSASDQTIALNLQNATATDFSILERAAIDLLPRA